ncbi:hypothetical protein P152DRAFT_429995 [Eremomyces bilateralis CBS 781.70]|uniref:Altered inheritance of mitochondria protein 6 n=1 Tax=Eremomyces bilateralis CBS 781.70 TaxID=1392243 RepID=A0A6G1GCV8_9PEZI|nr:uncharacterized protein P152DRAFT_429995 [Eremomyces bilateralis CBS 781.70]KAF1815731.1 hypothetical protein P152DRAFT_429995 [Eremomyces bilateralis CBS 781.70]
MALPSHEAGLPETRSHRREDDAESEDGRSYKDEDRERLLMSEEVPEGRSFIPPFWKRFGRIFRSNGPFRFESSGSYPASPRLPRPKTFGGHCLGLIVGFLTVLGLIHVTYFVLGLGPLFWTTSGNTYPDDWRHGQSSDDWMRYTTDFTRDILPIPCHSHNDYWRKVPVFEAIHYGCTGVEADVWLFDDELYVGHNIAALTRNRTFRSLYVEPLVALLDKQNGNTSFPDDAGLRGIFDEEPERTVVLLVDFKNGADSIWPYVQHQLEPLRQKNYLSYFDGHTVIPRPITVVATGDAPYPLAIANSTYRDMFFDAPLSSLTASLQSSEPFNSNNSYYASTNFIAAIGYPWFGSLSAAQRATITRQVDAAHARGLKARYWNTPGWPVAWRNHVWTTLVELGVDYLSADDLRAVAEHDWRKQKDRDW